MNKRFPPDGWREWLEEALERARRLVRELPETVWRGATTLWSELRERWPVARDRFLQLKERVDRSVDPLLARLGPHLRRAGSAAGGGWRRLRPHLRRAMHELGRRAPSRRQSLILAAVLVGVTWILWQRCGVAGCPDVDALRSYQPGGASVLLDRTGEQFADLAPMEYEVVGLDSLPEYVPAAFVAVEDRRFYEHDGVDWRRVLGAVWADVRAGGLVQGSSTIPMQLSRTLFPDRIRREEKTFRRKLMEVRVASEIENEFAKEEILELYLNHVYLGGGTYGIQAASRYYFGKDATTLDLEEAALLAALPRAPSHYDPRRHPERARARRDLVLGLMANQERISVEDAEPARERELSVSAEPERDPDGDRLAPYFVQHVRRLLEDELGEVLYAEPLKVYTTLDARAQQAAEEELETQLRSVERGAFGRLDSPPYSAPSRPGEAGTDYLQGAVVVLDAHGGEVRAWVGGRDYDHSRYDRARLAGRQAGSAFKPFVYAAALEAGLSPSQPIMDRPYRLARSGGRGWEPQNYSGRFEGRMSLREALVRSQNVPAVRLAAAVGPDHVRDFVRRAGVEGEVPESPVAALGVTTVRPVELATAYAAFAAAGHRPTPRFILRVEDADGNSLLETEAEREEVTSAATAFLLTDMLRDVVDRGTGTAVRQVGFRGPAAGKTGTTTDATDVWFAGYTPELVGVVWIGFDEVQPLAARATGGGVAAPVWGRIMSRVYRDRPVPQWERKPSRVVALWVDPETGLALEDGCRPRRGEARRELFLQGEEPVSTCPRRGGRDFFNRVGGWLESVFGSDPSDPGIPGEPDPDLGVPRLPQRGGGEEVNENRRSPVQQRSGDRAREREQVREREQEREARKRAEERVREERKRAEERIREARKRAEEQLREARKRAEERRREGGGGGG